MKKLCYADNVGKDVRFIEYDCNLKENVNEDTMSSFYSDIEKDSKLPNELTQVFHNIMESDVISFIELRKTALDHKEMDMGSFSNITTRFLDMFDFHDKKSYSRREVGQMIRVSPVFFGKEEQDKLNTMVESSGTNRKMLSVLSYRIKDSRFESTIDPQNKTLTK